MKKPFLPQKAKYLIVFGIGFLFFFILQYSHTFADPDSFYHAKMALLMKEQGVVTSFPWLGEFTVLGEAYTDQHFLYHIFLIPLVSFLNPITGIKLATVIFASLFLTILYWLLVKLGVRYALGFSLVLLTMNPLIFRLSLAKAPSFSLIILFIGIYFITKHRWKSLLILSSVYVWSYGGFFLIVVASGIYLFINIISRIIKKIWAHQRENASWLRIVFNKNWRLPLASLAGVILGIVINPYFPQNLSYYRYQLFEIGIKNYSRIIGVGGEWYPYDFISLIGSTPFLTIALVGAFIIFIIRIKKQTRRDIFFLILTLVFLILTLKSRRYVEYYIPFGCLFSFNVIGTFLKRAKLKQYWILFIQLYFRKKIMISVIVIYFLVTVPTVIVRGFIHERDSLVEGIPYTKFSRVSHWLSDNSEAGDIIFHSSWDEFPMLFYYNDKDYYIGGLDQTFMYLKNKDLHKKWVDITTGEHKEYLVEIIRDEFHAKYVLVSQQHGAMKSSIKAAKEFDKVYEDDEAIIYKVPGE